MSVDYLCLGCMEQKGTSEFCPHCGWKDRAGAESPLYLTPGTVLNDQYMIGRVLGHGGFGITYLAWDLNLSVKVAIKEYLPGALASRHPGDSRVSVYSGEAKGHFDYGLEKFIEEARALARFQNHPGVVSVVNFFHANGTGYLVMTYIEGITFKEYLDQNNGKVAFETARSILMPVMDALREVHAAGMLHRDISPDNIYLTFSNQVKLLDFGAAKYAVGEHSQSLSVILKPGFAPEEQYRSRGHQGSWTDVYALGATMYRAITGEVPPDALDRMERDEIKPPSKLGVQIPQAAEAVLMRALSVKAAGRIQDVASFQRSLMVAPAPPIPVPPISEKICHNCRKLINADAKVCVECGASFEKRPAPGNPDFALLGRRLLAYVIDSIPLTFFWVIVFLISESFTEALRHERVIDIDADFVTVVAMTIAWFGTGFVALLYSAVMEGSRLQGTLGKMAAGIVVTDTNGQRLSFGRALLRNLGKVISSSLCAICFLIALFNDKQQALHDLMAGCRVVKLCRGAEEQGSGGARVL